MPTPIDQLKREAIEGMSATDAAHDAILAQMQREHAEGRVGNTPIVPAQKKKEAA